MIGHTGDREGMQFTLVNFHRPRPNRAPSVAVVSPSVAELVAKLDECGENVVGFETLFVKTQILIHTREELQTSPQIRTGATSKSVVM